MRYSIQKVLAGVFAIALLIFAGTATAATVVREPGNESNALGITNLELDIGGVGTLLFNVEFINAPASEVYGDPVPFFDFNSGEAGDATQAVAQVLTDAGGIQFTDGRPAFDIGWAYGEIGDNDLMIELVATWEAARGDGQDDTWVRASDPDVEGYRDPNVTWAKFTVVPVPAAVWLFGSALGLLGWVRRRAT